LLQVDISDHYITPRGLNVANEGVIPFRKGARVPMHMHTERAHILVLSGSQREVVSRGALENKPERRLCHLIDGD